MTQLALRIQQFSAGQFILINKIYFQIPNEVEKKTIKNWDDYLWSISIGNQASDKNNEKMWIKKKFIWQSQGKIIIIRWLISILDYWLMVSCKPNESNKDCNTFLETVLPRLMVTEFKLSLCTFKIHLCNL